MRYSATGQDWHSWNKHWSKEDYRKATESILVKRDCGTMTLQEINGGILNQSQRRDVEIEGNYIRFGDETTTSPGSNCIGGNHYGYAFYKVFIPRTINDDLYLIWISSLSGVSKCNESETVEVLEKWLTGRDSLF